MTFHAKRIAAFRPKHYSDTPGSFEGLLACQEPHDADDLARANSPDEVNGRSTATPLARPRACLVTTATTCSPASISSS